MFIHIRIIQERAQVPPGPLDAEPTTVNKAWVLEQATLKMQLNHKMDRPLWKMVVFFGRLNAELPYDPEGIFSKGLNTDTQTNSHGGTTHYSSRGGKRLKRSSK